jgi:hypothetical protein
MAEVPGVRVQAVLRRAEAGFSERRRSVEEVVLLAVVVVAIRRGLRPPHHQAGAVVAPADFPARLRRVEVVRVRAAVLSLRHRQAEADHRLEAVAVVGLVEEAALGEAPAEARPADKMFFGTRRCHHSQHGFRP